MSTCDIYADMKSQMIEEGLDLGDLQLIIGEPGQGGRY